jgi:hypothetical protein
MPYKFFHWAIVPDLFQFRHFCLQLVSNQITQKDGFLKTYLFHYLK